MCDLVSVLSHTVDLCQNAARLLRERDTLHTHRQQWARASRVDLAKERIYDWKEREREKLRKRENVR